MSRRSLASFADSADSIWPLPEAGPLGVGMVLWIACNDAGVLHDTLVKRGGTILAPLADGPFGRFFVARDPDGYAITFHTARS
jgi:predicted enzyme related to lactoylglutathione lyase